MSIFYQKIKKWRKDNPEKYKEQRKRRHKEEKNTPKFRYYLYIKSAKERKYEFNLSFNQFMTFWQKPCYYCKENIETIGIDRIDNQIGYVVENLRSCCFQCNIMKSNYTEKEFINKCKNVAYNFNSL